MDLGGETPAGFDMRRLLRGRHALMLPVRLLSALAMIGAGFIGLAVLHDAQRSAQRMQINDGTWLYAVDVAFQFLYPAFCFAAIIECVVPLALRAGGRWRTVLWGLPVLAGIGGGAIIYRVFSLDELPFEPKTTMLVVGGALAFFMAASTQIVFWQATAYPEADASDFPLPWYAALIVTLIVFFGAHRGWMDVGPFVKDVEAYRAARWKSPNASVVPSKPAVEEWVH